MLFYFLNFNFLGKTPLNQQVSLRCPEGQCDDGTLKVAMTLIQDHSQINEDFEATMIFHIIQGFNMYQTKGSRELVQVFHS